MKNIIATEYSVKMFAATCVQKPRVSATFQSAGSARRSQARMVVRASAAAADEVPSPEKRGLMNLLLLGAIGAPVRRKGENSMWIG